MRTILHRELRNNSSKILEEVSNGETFEITNHGKVVAVLSPPALTPYERAYRRRESAARYATEKFSSIKPTIADRDPLEVLDDARSARRDVR